MSRTGILITPTLDEVSKAALSIDLPAIEAKKFFYHYESNGWKVGKVPMKSLMGALQGWKIRWEERGGGNGSGTGPVPNSAADRTIKSKELERVYQELRDATFEVGQDALGRKHYRPGQWEKIQRLKTLRDKLRRELGLC